MRKNLRWIALGIGIGISLSVAAAYVFGPRGSTAQMNLYTGAKWTYHHLLWHTWLTEHPVAEHTKWARSNMGTERTNYTVFRFSYGRGWFDSLEHGDGFARDIVKKIYELSVPDERKIELLHEFHQDIERMRDVNDKNRDKNHYKTLCKKWVERLEDNPKP